MVLTKGQTSRPMEPNKDLRNRPTNKNFKYDGLELWISGEMNYFQ